MARPANTWQQHPCPRLARPTLTMDIEGITASVGAAGTAGLILCDLGRRVMNRRVDKRKTASMTARNETGVR